MKAAKHPPKTIREIVEYWPSRKVFAAEVGEELATVHAWVGRNTIPGPKILPVVEAAHLRGFDLVTEAAIARIIAVKRAA